MDYKEIKKYIKDIEPFQNFSDDLNNLIKNIFLKVEIGEQIINLVKFRVFAIL